MELLRREALQDARDPAGAAAASDHDPAAPRALPAPVEGALVPAAPHQARQQVSSVSRDLLYSFFGPLPVQPVHPLGDIVMEYARAGEARMPELARQATAEFATEFWAPGSNVWHSTSRAAHVSSSGMSVQQLRRTERRFVAAAELAERHCQHRMQTQLAEHNPGVELIAFIEGARYDEASSVLSVEQPSMDYLMAANIDPSELSPLLRSILDENQPKEAVPTKVFQTESQWCALLAVPAEDTTKPKAYTLVSSDMVTSPQILQRNTASCVAQALVALSTCRTRTVSNFAWKMRLVCSDRGSPNLAAERMILQSREGWHLLFFPCEIHMSTGAQSKGLLLMDDMVSKLIRTSLSLRLGGWMRIFRRCLLQEIFSTLEVLEGRCSDSAALYRKRAICMFLKAGKTRKHAALLSALPNGDWTSQDKVQVFVRPGVAWDRVAMSLLVAKALITALCGSNFRIFNRKRWTNNDLAVNQFGLLESCHKLFSRSYRRWLKAVGYKGPMSHLLEAEAGERPVPAAAHIALEEAAGADGGDAIAALGEGAMGGGEADGDGEAARAPAAPEGLEIALPGALQDNADFAAVNQKTGQLARSGC